MGLWWKAESCIYFGSGKTAKSHEGLWIPKGTQWWKMFISKVKLSDKQEIQTFNWMEGIPSLSGKKVSHLMYYSKVSYFSWFTSQSKNWISIISEESQKKIIYSMGSMYEVATRLIQGFSLQSFVHYVLNYYVQENSSSTLVPATAVWKSYL